MEFFYLVIGIVVIAVLICYWKICLIIISILIALIISFKIIQKIIRNRRWKAIDDENARKRATEQARQAKEKERKLNEQLSLIERYKSSPQVHHMIKCICGENYQCNLPDEIRIDNKSVISIKNGVQTPFYFVSHRIADLSNVVEYGTGDFEKYIIRPQVAMAEAINHILGNEYAILDNAKRTLKTYDDDYETTIFYVADYVLMRRHSRYHF